MHNACKINQGEMLEWLKRHAWKACILQKGIRGSNPRLSAEHSGQKELVTNRKLQIDMVCGFFYYSEVSALRRFRINRCSRAASPESPLR